MPLGVTPPSGRTNGNMLPLNADGHFIQLEGRVGRLETDVSEIKGGINTLLSRPQNPGFTQAISTVLTVLAVCGFVFAFAEWRLNSAVSPLEKAVQSVIAAETGNASAVIENRIKNAVLEERMSWMRGISVPKSDPQR